MANLNTGLTAAQIMQAFGNALDSNIHMTAEEKEKLESLENYDDTEVKQDISDLADDLENIYGLGTLIPDNSDLDDYKTPGSYYISTPASAQTLIMCPATYGFRMNVTTLNGSARFVQTITEAIYNSSATTSLNVYKRAYTVRGWSDWYLYTGTAVQPINTDYEMIDLLHTEPYASNIENGSFSDNDGQPTPRSDRVRCNSFIDIPAGSTKFTVFASIDSENCKFFADMHDSSGQYLYSVTSSSDPLTNTAYYNFVDCGTYRAVPATAEKMRIGLRNQASTNFSPSSLTDFKIIFYST